jgi:nucleoside-diphosphate-sugar epimerase|tara:strand:+ start:1252 stop:2142 length:891 start_codon:yes stop_codon:yes gene_type:complete
MKILITGLNGFLGKNISEYLNNQNFEILAIVRKKNKNYPKNFKIIKGDIQNLSIANINKIKKFKPNTLLNLAWYGIPDFSYKNSLKNIEIHLNFLNKIVQIESINKIIMTGSCWEYPDHIGRCKETLKNKPLSFFAWSKNSIYDYLKIIAKINDINLVWFRIFFMYGKYQKNESLIPSIINSLKKSKKPNILNPGHKNDFIHIDDVCRAILIAINKKDINGIFNIGSGIRTNVGKIYNKLLIELNISNKSYKLKKSNKINQIANYANLNKISSKLKWFPKINIEKGLKKMVNFYYG